MFTNRSLLRLGAGAIAAATSVALAAGPVAAAPNEGPYVFDAAGSADAVSIVVGLPAAIAQGLEPVVSALPGIELVDNALEIDLASVVGGLELPLVDELPGTVSGLAEALPVQGSIAELVSMLAGGNPLQCLDTPIDVVVPPGAETPLLSLTLLDAECSTDTEGRSSVAISQIADLEVNLAGALALLPAEVTQPLTDTVDELIATVEDTILTPLIDQVITPVQDLINENTGLGLDVTEAVRVPELIDVPIISINLIESRTESITEGALIHTVTTSTLAGVRLLGTVCLNDVTYRAEAFATGEPGGNDYMTSIPTGDLAVCDTTSLAPVLRLLEQDGVIGDVLVNLGDGQLSSLGDTLAGLGLPTDELLGALEDLLATLGVSTVVQGSERDGVRSEDGRQAGVAIDPFRITAAPLNNIAAGTPLEGLSVELRGLTVASAVAAAPAPPPAPEEPTPAPEPAPEPPVSLPRTGGGAAAAVLGLAAIGGATTLRRRG